MMSKNLFIINLGMQGNKKPFTFKMTTCREEQARAAFIQRRQRMSMSRESKEIKRIQSQRKDQKIYTSIFQGYETDKTNIFKGKGNSQQVYAIKNKSGLPQIYNPILPKKQNSSLSLFNKQRATTRMDSSQNFSSEYLQNHSTSSRVNFHRHSKQINRRQIQNLRQMDKDKKNQLYRVIRNQFHSLINTTNLLSVKNQCMNFYAYIERGNYGIIIKQVIKRRWWWHIVDDPNKANLVWNQWQNKSILENLSQIPAKDEMLAIEKYRGASEILQDSKQYSIRKILDEKTFKKVKPRIRHNAHEYFCQKNQKTPFFLKKTELSDEITSLAPDQPQIIHNHVQGCLNLHSKKLLFSNFHYFMKKKQMDPFEYLPLTFYINDIDSEAYKSLFKKFGESENQGDENRNNIWICKPGENSNRGNGIRIINSKQQLQRDIQGRLKNNSNNKTVIVQKYIENCYLINNRKFDIRCYILLTTVNGILKGYWYHDGYIRTSSKQYDLQNIDDIMIHLTNDAVQKKGEQYGKHQDQNKMSFEGFKQYLKKIGTQPQKFLQAYQKMKLISYYLIASVSQKIKRKQFTFQLFGLDFLLDQNLKPYLIQANSNPCLEYHGKILGKIIYSLVQNVITTAIDPIFPPPSKYKKKTVDCVSKDYFQTNKFELIFASKELIKQI